MKDYEGNHLGLLDSQQSALAGQLGLSSLSVYLKRKKPSRHEKLLSLESQALETLRGKAPFEDRLKNTIAHSPTFREESSE